MMAPGAQAHLGWWGIGVWALSCLGTVSLGCCRWQRRGWGDPSRGRWRRCPIPRHSHSCSCICAQVYPCERAGSWTGPSRSCSLRVGTVVISAVGLLERGGLGAQLGLSLPLPGASRLRHDVNEVSPALRAYTEHGVMLVLCSLSGASAAV